jgi:hypothetical protein
MPTRWPACGIACLRANQPNRPRPWQGRFGKAMHAQSRPFRFGWSPNRLRRRRRSRRRSRLAIRRNCGCGLPRGFAGKRSGPKMLPKGRDTEPRWLRSRSRAGRFPPGTVLNGLPLGCLTAKQERSRKRPRPQILNDPKSLYQSPSGPSGSDSTQRRSRLRSAIPIARSRIRSIKCWQTLRREVGPALDLRHQPPKTIRPI